MSTIPVHAFRPGFHPRTLLIANGMNGYDPEFTTNPSPEMDLFTIPELPLMPPPYQDAPLAQYGRPSSGSQLPSDKAFNVLAASNEAKSRQEDIDEFELDETLPDRKPESQGIARFQRQPVKKPATTALKPILNPYQSPKPNTSPSDTKIRLGDSRTDAQTENKHSLSPPTNVATSRGQEVPIVSQARNGSTHKERPFTAPARSDKNGLPSEIANVILPSIDTRNNLIEAHQSVLVAQSSETILTEHHAPSEPVTGQEHPFERHPRYDAPEYLRIFKDGLEVDIWGHPLREPKSPITMTHRKKRKTPSTHSGTSHDDSLEDIALEDQNSLWGYFVAKK
jgi:hypothetical protein